MEEIKLRNLLDLQRFTQKNKRLCAMIGTVSEKHGFTEGRRALSDEEVEVWAAGDLSAARTEESPFDRDGGEESRRA